jgi:hypothetical protein
MMTTAGAEHHLKGDEARANDKCEENHKAHGGRIHGWPGLGGSGIQCSRLRLASARTRGPPRPPGIGSRLGSRDSARFRKERLSTPSGPRNARPVSRRTERARATEPRIAFETRSNMSTTDAVFPAHEVTGRLRVHPCLAPRSETCGPRSRLRSPPPRSSIAQTTGSGCAVQKVASTSASPTTTTICESSPDAP